MHVPVTRDPRGYRNGVDVVIITLHYMAPAGEFK